MLRKNFCIIRKELKTISESERRKCNRIVFELLSLSNFRITTPPTISRQTLPDLYKKILYMNIYSTQHPNSVIINGRGSNMTAPAEWSWPENKIFEDALVKYPEELPDRWQKIAGELPGKSPHDVIAHYEALLHDVAAIEAGRIQVPSYPELTETRGRSSAGSFASNANRSQCERKKGKPWTVEEHMYVYEFEFIYLVFIGNCRCRKSLCHQSES